MSEGKRERAAVLAAAARPRGVVNAMLLDRYVALVDWDAARSAQQIYWALACLRALIVALEEVELKILNHAALDQLRDLPAERPIEEAAQRRAVAQLRRDLQAWGELPSVRARRAARALDMLVEELPPASGAVFSAWIRRRSEALAPPQLRAEAHHLVVLEQLATLEPDLDPEALLMLWLSRIVRQVVNCPCPPVARTHSPHHCPRHPDYPLGPSPRARKQRELLAAGRRYLAFRKENTT